MSSAAGNNNTSDCDVVIVNLAVHGGGYHKLIHFSELLNANDIRCRLMLNTSPPLGLQIGLDINDDQKRHLEAHGVLVLSFDQIKQVLGHTKAQLYVFDASKTANIRKLMDLVKIRHDVKTAQICSLYHEFPRS